MPTVKTVTVKLSRNLSEVSISVDPEPLRLDGEAADVDVEWQLVIGGGVTAAEFDAGVHIKNAWGKFNDKGKDKTKHQWGRNGGPNGKSYHYRIGVVDLTDAANPRTYELDPTIRN